MSSCTTTVPNSVRNSDPVGQTSRQAACAVLADVGGHQPAQLAQLAGQLRARRVLDEVAVQPVVHIHGTPLLDERDVPPGVGAEAAGVVHRHARMAQAVLRDAVPLLARHLARLAADADAAVGEEAHPRPGARAVGAHLELGAHPPALRR
jgi:hypothetical protein